MDPLQTSYSATMAPLVEGMLVNSEKHNIISRLAEADIGFGKVAVQGTGDRQIKPSAASATFRGITLRDPTQLQDLYKQYGAVQVLEKGCVAVIASVAVSAGQPVYYVPATGVFTNVSNSNANTLIANALWDTTTTTTNQLAVVRLR
jgi:hypothetical protein